MSPNNRLILLGVLAVIVAGMWILTFLSKRMDHVTEGVSVLDTMAFESFSIVTLGTGETFENHQRRGPAVLVGDGEDLVLFDAGRGVAESLRAAGVPVAQPRALFLSSLRPENTVGLDDLWLGGWLGRRDTPLRVHGPPGTAALVEGLRSAHGSSAEHEAALWGLPQQGGAIEAIELTGGEAIEVGTLAVRVAALPGGPHPSLAFRVGEEPASVVIGGAGFGDAAWLELARGAGIWVAGVIHGASLDAALDAELNVFPIPEDERIGMEREAATRLRLEAVGALATEAGIRSVILTRLRPPPVFDSVYEGAVNESFRGPVFVAEDGESFTP